MSSSEAAPEKAPRRRLLADLTPLRVNPAYRRMWFGLSLSGIGAQLTTVAVGLQVYALTHSTFKVGLVGLFALVPLIVSGLYGGSVIDALDRRKVISGIGERPAVTLRGDGVEEPDLATGRLAHPSRISLLSTVVSPCKR